MTGSIYLFLAKGFEEIEAVSIMDVLRRAELEVVAVSITDELMVEGAHNISIKADCRINEISESQARMIILPGGMPGTKNLAENEDLSKILKCAIEYNIPIAAICAAPLVLGKYGLLKGRKATCYPGFENQIKGAILVDKSVVRDGDIITANGPAAAIKFSLNVIEYLLGADKAQEVAKQMLITL